MGVGVGWGRVVSRVWRFGFTTFAFFRWFWIPHRKVWHKKVSESVSWKFGIKKFRIWVRSDFRYCHTLPDYEFCFNFSVLKIFNFSGGIGFGLKKSNGLRIRKSLGLGFVQILGIFIYWWSEAWCVTNPKGASLGLMYYKTTFIIILHFLLTFVCKSVDINLFVIFLINYFF